MVVRLCVVPAVDWQPVQVVAWLHPPYDSSRDSYKNLEIATRYLYVRIRQNKAERNLHTIFTVHNKDNIQTKCREMRLKFLSFFNNAKKKSIIQNGLN